ncbi:MAG TPA: glycosyltransferase family 4 protein, partial [Puia sp.]|nr:glycosyltransferase family 4 protein [Puia sp.]
AYISDSELVHQRSLLNKSVKYLFLRWYFSRIDWFLTVGDLNEAFYRFYGVRPGKMIRMHFPIDKNLYEQRYRERAELSVKARIKYNIGQSDLVLSVVGKLVPWKRQGDIIDALIELEVAGVNAHLLLVGSGSLREELEKKSASLSKAKVHFTGFVDPEELPAIYAATDIYVHPAEKEPHSLAISEAIYMGCPIVLSDRCGSSGPGDDVQALKNGYVYKCGHIADLSDKILKLAKNIALRRAFGNCSHEIAVEFQKRAHGEFMSDLVLSLR